jgi:hypothetical protein
MSGYKEIGIFEYGLSYHARYCMHIKENECIITRNGHGNVTKIFRGTIEDGVKFVYEHLPYEWRNGESGAEYQDFPEVK